MKFHKGLDELTNKIYKESTGSVSLLFCYCFHFIVILEDHSNYCSDMGITFLFHFLIKN